MDATLSTIQKIRVGFAIALVLSLCVTVLSFRTTAKLIDTNRLVVRSTGAIRNLDGTIAALHNLERSRLAWVMAGRAMHDLRARRSREQACRVCHDSGFEKYRAEAARFHNTHLGMIADLTRHLQQLRALTAFEPAQRDRLDILEPLIQKKIALAKEEIEVQKTGGFSGLSSVVLDEELGVTSEIHKIADDMDHAEGTLLARQLEERDAMARYEILTVSLLGFLTMLVAVVAYVVIRRDLAQREALEEQLRQTMKMEAVGRLAGGVAHDFNNLLTSVLFGADLLRGELGEDHPSIDHLREIKKAGETAASVTQQLLAFSRRQTLQPQRLMLNSLAMNMGGMLRRLVGDQYRLETSLEPALGWVEADPSQIEQVIMNLALNARDAMPQGGSICIETANANLNGEKTCWCGLALEGAFVVLTISDHGVGMAEETRSRVFEPFFTTKERGKGTGLGLATVYGIITQSNGRVRLQSAPGEGTTFEIYLPRVNPPTDGVIGPKVETRDNGRHGTVLLVEDDEALRRLLCNALTAAGHQVLEARDGEEGLQVAQSSKRRIDLLITDVMMPRMNGLALYRRLEARDSALKSIFISGHADGIVSPDCIVDGKTTFLAKPFTARELLEKVGKSL
jgi:signal transduction histidine kinase/CheY-like chemotaxis protein